MLCNASKMLRAPKMKFAAVYLSMLSTLQFFVARMRTALYECDFTVARIALSTSELRGREWLALAQPVNSRLFCGTRSFVTVFTTDCPPSLPSTRWVLPSMPSVSHSSLNLLPRALGTEDALCRPHSRRRLQPRHSETRSNRNFYVRKALSANTTRHFTH